MRNTETRLPRWAKLLGVVVALVVLLILVVIFLLPDGRDGGGHRPRFDHGMDWVA
jgi:hypothetical protein